MKILFSLLLLVSTQAFVSIPTQAAGNELTKEETLANFPSRSVGKVSIRRLNSRSNEIVRTLQAAGTIKVPSGCALDLKLNYSGSENTKFLLKLPPSVVLWFRNDSLEITDESLEHIAHLTNLVTLDLEGAGVSDTSTKHLAALKSLTYLNLGDNLISARGLTFLPSLNKLTWLRLSRSNLGDGIGPYIKTLTNLRTLDLCGSQVTDKIIPFCLPLAHLRDFNLRRNNITDRAVPDLVKLKSLDRLDLTDTHVSPDGLAKLKSLPKLGSLVIRRHDLDQKELATVQTALRHVRIEEGSREKDLPRELFAPLR